MKKYAAFLLAILTLAFPLCVSAEDTLNTTAKAYIVVDAASGLPLIEYNADEKLSSANVSMNMSILLFLEAMDAGTLKETDKVTVSENAWKTGGTSMFLDNGETYPAGDLLKGAIMASGNDAVMALAEHLYGNEAAFVEKMNAKAQEMGLTGTHFINALGADDPEQYTTARDMAAIMAAICEYPQYFKWSGTWLDTYVHPSGRETEMTNYNRLIRFYNGADGGKTGSSATAGYCIAATAKRGADRFVYAGLGDESSNSRFDSAKTALDYAFNNYTSKTPVKEGRTVVRDVPVANGDIKLIDGVAATDIKLLLTKEDEGKLDKQVSVTPDLAAPIAKGQKIGEITVVANGREMRKADILSSADVCEMSWGTALGRIAEIWVN